MTRQHVFLVASRVLGHVYEQLPYHRATSSLFEEYIILESFLLTGSECAHANVQEHGNVEALRLTNIMFLYSVYNYSRII